MQVGTKEFYDILERFEKDFCHIRLDKESKDLWKIGQIYQDGETNTAYHAYILGYALGRLVYMNES